jgi:hypothetical protein
MWALLTSRVHTAAARPNVVAFARRTSSSMSENLRTDNTGPNISSRAIAISSFTSVNTVGSTKNPRSPTRCPPVAQTGSFVLPLLNIAHDLFELVTINLRSLFGSGGQKDFLPDVSLIVRSPFGQRNRELNLQQKAESQHNSIGPD